MYTTRHSNSQGLWAETLSNGEFNNERETELDEMRHVTVRVSVLFEVVLVGVNSLEGVFEEALGGKDRRVTSLRPAPEVDILGQQGARS